MVPDSFFQIGVSLEIITLDRFYKKIPKCFIFRQTRRFRGTASVNTYGKNWFESLSSILRYFCCCLFGSAYWDKLSLKCTLSCIRYSEYRYHDIKTTLAKIKHKTKSQSNPLNKLHWVQIKVIFYHIILTLSLLSL